MKGFVRLCIDASLCVRVGRRVEASTLWLFGTLQNTGSDWNTKCQSLAELLIAVRCNSSAEERIRKGNGKMKTLKMQFSVSVRLSQSLLIQ